MNEEPDNFVLSRLLIGFRSELYELLVTSWCECVDKGFEPVRVESALVSSSLTELLDLAIESMGPEETARFVSAITNERLKSLQQRMNTP
jgi:hypothetical protein